MNCMNGIPVLMLYPYECYTRMKVYRNNHMNGKPFFLYELYTVENPIYHFIARIVLVFFGVYGMTFEGKMRKLNDEFRIKSV